MTTTRTTPVRARRPYLAGIALAGALVALTGCSGSGSPAGGSRAATSPPGRSAAHPGAAASTIVISHFAFSPATLTVKPGATVTVKNDDSTPHTVTTDGSKLFDTGNIGPGKTATFKAPSMKGSYSYICSIHQFMKGSLTVS